ncbi:MAG TPA: energy transducer TonB [Bryobacteraceae bacterium]|nr:energy transducer TonB [Bryobacteraceae bacterium]
MWRIFLGWLLLAACAREPPAPAAPQQRIMVGDVLCSAGFHRYVRPVWPKAARSRGITGTVMLRAMITKTGEIRELTVLSGDPLLVAAALAAVRKWRYNPPCPINAQPVDIITQIDVSFP